MIGPQSYTPRYSNDDKNLIAEQPGRFVLFVGVLLAITLGLIVRGLISPNKVKAHVAAAAASINKDLQVQFETATVSLSRGLLPRFAVLISNVRMESTNPCWMTPTLTADEIRLPLSFWALVQGENPVTEVGAGKVRVQMQTAFKNCDNNTPAAAAPSTGAPAPAQFVTLKNKTSRMASTAPPTEVEALSIDQLIVEAPALSAPLELNSFSLRLKSNSPRVIEMTAKTHLMRDEQVGDYLSHAAIWGEYSEFPKPRVLARIQGNWREGSYQWNANYLVKDEELTSEMDLKHVPLSQVAHVLKKFNWLKSEINARQVWVSLNAQMAGKTSQLNKAHMQLKDLRLEGDLGDVRVPEAQVTSFEPLRYQPFRIDIERLSVEKVLLLAGRPHPSAALGQLGTFTGKAEVNSEDDIEISGLQRGLEFIFANKGQRELQTLKEIAARLKLSKGRWNLLVSNALVDQGALRGSLEVNADRDWRNVDIDGKAPQIQLAPNVIRLMTGGGRVGAIAADVHLKLREGRTQSLKGTITAEDLAIEGVEVTKSRLLLDSLQEEIVAQAQVQRLTINVGSPSFQVLKDLIEPDWMNEGKLEIKNLNSQLKFQTLKNFAWKNLTAQLQPGLRLSSDGGWDASGALTGQVQSGSGKLARRWILSGRRDLPVFSVAEASKKRNQ